MASCPDNPTRELIQLILDAQAILATHLPPDGPGETATLNALFELLDGPRSREALSHWTLDDPAYVEPGRPK